MELSNKKSAFYWFLYLIIGGSFFVYFINKYQSEYLSKLIEIHFDKAVEVQVKEAYNERGIYILNDSLFLPSMTPIINSNKEFKDYALVRFGNSKFTPHISQISAPFLLSKKQKNDTLKITKGTEVIFLKLVKAE